MKTNEDGLLPCPFCGGTKLSVQGDDKKVGVFCNDCYAVGPDEYVTYPRAVEWNTRATPQVEIVEGLEEAIDWENTFTDSNRYTEQMVERLAEAARLYAKLQKGA